MKPIAAAEGTTTVGLGCIIPPEKREELPMSEEALRGWYWAGVIVFALAVLVA